MKRPLRRRADPDRELKREVRKLRAAAVAAEQEDVQATLDDVERLLADGWTKRESGIPQRKPAPLNQAWGGKLPPEKA